MIPRSKIINCTKHHSFQCWQRSSILANVQMKRAALDFVKGRLEQKGNSLFEFYQKRKFLQKGKKSKSSLAVDLTCFEKMLKTSHCNLLFSSQKQGATSWISLWAMPISSLVLIFPICSSAWPYFQRGNGRNKSFRWFNINLQRQSAIKKTTYRKQNSKH